MTLDKVKLKTINNQSVIGDGNISVGGSSVDIVTSWSSTTSDSKVASEKLTKNSLDDKIAKSNTSGLVKNDGSIDTTSYLSTNDIGSSSSTSSSKIVACNDSRLSDARTPTSHNQASSTITDSNTYSNIGNIAQTQESINGAIDTKLGTYTHDTGWQDLTFPTGFGHYSSSQKAQYRRIGKVVYVRGAVKNTNAFTSSNDTSNQIATIGDATCRPSTESEVSIQQGSGQNRFLLTIDTDGKLYCARYGTTTNSQVGANSWLNIYCSFLVE